MNENRKEIAMKSITSTDDDFNQNENVKVNHADHFFSGRHDRICVLLCRHF